MVRLLTGHPWLVLLLIGNTLLLSYVGILKYTETVNSTGITVVVWTPGEVTNERTDVLGYIKNGILDFNPSSFCADIIPLSHQSATIVKKIVSRRGVPGHALEFDIYLLPTTSNEAVSCVATQLRNRISAMKQIINDRESELRKRHNIKQFRTAIEAISHIIMPSDRKNEIVAYLGQRLEDRPRTFNWDLKVDTMIWRNTSISYPELLLERPVIAIIFVSIIINILLLFVYDFLVDTRFLGETKKQT